MSMITASLWVPRGAAAAFPSKYDVDECELERISKLAKLRLDDVREDLNESRHGGHVGSENEDSDMENDGVKVLHSQTYVQALVPIMV